MTLAALVAFVFVSLLCYVKDGDTISDSVANGLAAALVMVVVLFAAQRP